MTRLDSYCMVTLEMRQFSTLSHAHLVSLLAHGDDIDAG